MGGDAFFVFVFCFGHARFRVSPLPPSRRGPIRSPFTTMRLDTASSLTPFSPPCHRRNALPHQIHRKQLRRLGRSWEPRTRSGPASPLLTLTWRPPGTRGRPEARLSFGSGPKVTAGPGLRLHRLPSCTSWSALTRTAARRGGCARFIRCLLRLLVSAAGAGACRVGRRGQREKGASLPLGTCVSRWTVTVARSAAPPVMSRGPRVLASLRRRRRGERRPTMVLPRRHPQEGVGGFPPMSALFVTGVVDRRTPTAAVAETKKRERARAVLPLPLRATVPVTRTSLPCWS